MNLKFTKGNIARTALAGILIIAVFAAGMLTGCESTNKPDSTDSSKQQITGNPEEKQTATEESTTKQEEKQDKIMGDYKALLENNISLHEVVEFLDNNISLVSSENASVMIDRFEKLQKEFLPKLDERFYKEDSLQTQMREVYMEGFDISKLDEIKDEDLKELLAETRDSGYKVETAEGMFFPVIDYEFYKKYSPYVTPDIKGYIDLMAVESNSTPAKDAALVISWEEILKRALNQEKFISQYQNSIKIDDVKDLYKKYLSFTLFGLNNTPLFSYDSKAMAAEAKEAYMNAVESNSDSEFLKIVNDFLELLKKTNFKLTDEVDNYRKDAVEN
jgi:hypothetical protein